VDNLIKLQEGNIKKGIKKRAFVILDDCLCEDELKSQKIKELAVQGRHHFISVIMTTQYPYLISPTIRGQISCSLCFDVGLTRRSLEALYDSYGQRFKSYNDFKDFYYKAIKDYKFISVQNNDEVKVLRALENIDSFKLKFNKKFKSKPKK
jgi:hypothetical protein